MNKKILIGIGIFAIVIVIFIIKSNPTEEVIDEGLNGFAQCLTEKGVTMYGAEWCSHCKNQKKLFGDSFEYIDYVDCDKNNQACSLAEVKGYPTWNINEQNYPGEQSLETLSSLTGCALI